MRYRLVIARGRDWPPRDQAWSIHDTQTNHVCFYNYTRSSPPNDTEAAIAMLNRRQRFPHSYSWYKPERYIMEEVPRA